MNINRRNDEEIINIMNNILINSNKNGYLCY